MEEVAFKSGFEEQRDSTGEDGDEDKDWAGRRKWVRQSRVHSICRSNGS